MVKENEPFEWNKMNTAGIYEAWDYFGWVEKNKYIATNNPDHIPLWILRGWRVYKMITKDSIRKIDQLYP